MEYLTLKDPPLLEKKLKLFTKNITPKNEQLCQLSQSSEQLRKIFQDCSAIKEVFALGRDVYHELQLFDHFIETDIIVLFVGNKVSFSAEEAIEIIEEILNKKFFAPKIEKISHNGFLCYKIQWQQFTFRIAPAIQRSWFKNGYYCIDYYEKKWRYTRDSAILSERLQWCDNVLEGRLVPLLRLMRFCQTRNDFEHPQLTSMVAIACNTLQACPTYRYGIEKLLSAYSWIEDHEYSQITALDDYEFIQYSRQKFFGSDFLTD